MNRWTTFLKARLICSVIGDDGVETRFDELREAPPPPVERVREWRRLSLTFGSSQGTCSSSPRRTRGARRCTLCSPRPGETLLLLHPPPLCPRSPSCLRPSSVFKGSAVCVYAMADIRNVFNGPFAHKHGHNYQWTEYTGKIPYPRPGTVRGSREPP